MTVHVFGSINVDIIASVDRLPAAGETVLARETRRLPGGKGANQAVAAARMGAHTILIGAVGDDEAGRWMCDQLAGAGVNVDGVRTVPGEQSGTAYVAVDAGGENQIIVAPGANRRTESTGPVASGVLLAQLEVPLAAVAALFTRSTAIRILNAAPPVPQARALFDHVDLLIMNQHELAMFLALPEPPRTVEAALAARTLLTRSDQAVIVTLGAGGAMAVWQDRHLHVPALPIRPVDTIGAGDCFCGALAALLDEGRGIDDAMPLANAAAALCALGHGAIPAMPERARVEAALRAAATEHALAIKNSDSASIS